MLYVKCNSVPLLENIVPAGRRGAATSGGYLLKRKAVAHNQLIQQIS